MKKQNVTEHRWPEALGRITTMQTHDPQYMVYKIQDAHFGLETQQGIVEILRYLYRQFGVQHMCVEGARGAFIDFSRLRPTLTPEEIKELGTLLQDKAVTGPEYLAITSDLLITLYGVEDEEQYVKNVEALHWVSMGYQILGQFFEPLKEYVAGLKTSRFSTELLEFDRALQEFESDKLGLTDILKKALGGDDKQSRLSLEEYPSLGIFLKASEFEQTIVLASVRRESIKLFQDIIEVLSAPRVQNELFDRVVLAQYQLEQRDNEEIKTLPRSALLKEYNRFIDGVLHSLMLEAIKVRTGELPTTEIYDSFIDLSSLCGLDIRNYPNLLKYTHYLHQYDVIKEKFSEELHGIIEKTREALFANDDEREIDAAWRAVTGLYRLCRLEASPDGYEQFNDDFEELSVSLLLEKIVSIKDSRLPEKYEALYRSARFVDTLLNTVVGKAGGSKQDILTAVDKALRTISEEEADGNRSDEEADIDALKILTKLGEELGIDIHIEQIESDASEIPANPGEGLSLNSMGEKADNDPTDVSATLSDDSDIHPDDILVATTIDAVIEGAYKFYQMAPARGLSLVENTLRYMKNNGIKKVALITGGFQTSYILSTLDEKKISFKVIVPPTTTSGIQTDRINKDEYLGRFGREIHPFLQDLRRRAELLNNTEAG